MPNTEGACSIILTALLMKKIISCSQKTNFSLILQHLKNVFRSWIWGPKIMCISFGQQAFLLKDVPRYYNEEGGKAIGSTQNSYQNVFHVERAFKPTRHALNTQCISACETIHSVRECITLPESQHPYLWNWHHTCTARLLWEWNDISSEKEKHLFSGE